MPTSGCYSVVRPPGGASETDRAGSGCASLQVGVWGWPWGGAAGQGARLAPTHFHSTSSCSLMVPSSVMSTTMTCGRVVKKSVMSHVTVPTARELRPRSSVTWG